MQKYTGVYDCICHHIRLYVLSRNMNTDAEMLAAVGKMVKRSGENAVLVRLIEAGIGTQTADALVKGRYKKRPSPLLKAALARALTVNTEERAS